MESEKLEKIGLSKSESQIYLRLLEIGSCKAGRLAKETKYNRTTIYKVLESLIQKGLVSYVLKENRKYLILVIWLLIDIVLIQIPVEIMIKIGSLEVELWDLIGVIIFLPYLTFLMFLGDHNRSAIAAILGQMRESTVSGETNSPQLVASPPRIFLFCSSDKGASSGIGSFR